MQPVIWVVQFRDRSKIMEIDENGVETVFGEKLLERKKDFAFIGLFDLVNNLRYSINLLNGRVVLGGMEYSPSKEIGGRLFKVSEIPHTVYNENVVQYKVSKPMTIRTGIQIEGQSEQATPASFNIGYRIKLPDNFVFVRHGDGRMKFDWCQVMVSLDADTLNPSLSTSFTCSMIKKDGSVEQFKV